MECVDSLWIVKSLRLFKSNVHCELGLKKQASYNCSYVFMHVHLYTVYTLCVCVHLSVCVRFTHSVKWDNVGHGPGLISAYNGDKVRQIKAPSLFLLKGKTTIIQGISCWGADACISSWSPQTQILLSAPSLSATQTHIKSSDQSRPSDISPLINSSLDTFLFV